MPDLTGVGLTTARERQIVGLVYVGLKYAHQGGALPPCGRRGLVGARQNVGAADWVCVGAGTWEFVGAGTWEFVGGAGVVLARASEREVVRCLRMGDGNAGLHECGGGARLTGCAWARGRGAGVEHRRQNERWDIIRMGLCKRGGCRVGRGLVGVWHSAHVKLVMRGGSGGMGLARCWLAGHAGLKMARKRGRWCELADALLAWNIYCRYSEALATLGQIKIEKNIQKGRPVPHITSAAS